MASFWDKVKNAVGLAETGTDLASYGAALYGKKEGLVANSAENAADVTEALKDGFQQEDIGKIAGAAADEFVTRRFGGGVFATALGDVVQMLAEKVADWLADKINGPEQQALPEGATPAPTHSTEFVGPTAPAAKAPEVATGPETGQQRGSNTTVTLDDDTCRTLDGLTAQLKGAGLKEEGLATDTTLLTNDKTVELAQMAKMGITAETVDGSGLSGGSTVTTSAKKLEANVTPAALAAGA